MPYIGQPLNAGNLAVQTGTGDGADTTPIATLDYSVGSSESLAIYLDGVKQAVATYTASGTTLTFTTAPPNGVGIEVVFLALPISLPTPGDSTVTSAKIVDGAIVNADINASAAIAQSKLAGGVSKVVVTTYDISTATGSQAITGAGFTPTAVLVMMGITGTSQISMAIGESSSLGNSYANDHANGADTWAVNPNFALLRTSGGQATATITSLDADGMTLAWTKGTSPTGTATQTFIFYR